MQFHPAHAFRQTAVEALAREGPGVLDLWHAAGAEAIEFEDYGGTMNRVGPTRDELAALVARFVSKPQPA